MMAKGTMRNTSTPSGGHITVLKVADGGHITVLKTADHTHYGHITVLKVSDHTFALVIEGTSMAPEFQPGDKVVIDPALAPRPGDLVVAKREKDQEATFKKYRLRAQDERGRDVIELVPLNLDWPTLLIDADSPGLIVGIMVEHRRYRQE